MIVLEDRYGKDWRWAPVRVLFDYEKNGGNIDLERHISHIIQEWQWPGQEWMFVPYEDDDWNGRCKCGHGYEPGLP